MTEWRVFWVPTARVQTRARLDLLTEWEDLAARETLVGVRPGSPILLAPDYRVDELLGLYFSSSPFVDYTPETKRNYVTDLCLYFNFLWRRGKLWTQADAADLSDYQYWRQEAPANPQHVGGSKWNRELAALSGLYNWACRASNAFVPVNPVLTHQVMGRDGKMMEIPLLRSGDAKGSNVHWLTPRAFRRWVDVGLRCHTREGLPAREWAGRLEDRNVACAHLLYSSGMRLLEGSSLLAFEVPTLKLDGGRYYAGRVAEAHSPFSTHGVSCSASFLLCLACPNARIHPGHHPRLAHLHQALENLRSVMDPAEWHADWHDAHARLSHLKRLLGPPAWDKALRDVTGVDRDMIDHLLKGDFAK